MSTFGELARKVVRLSKGAPASPAEVQAIVEIAYLTASADSILAEEERQTLLAASEELFLASGMSKEEARLAAGRVLAHGVPPRERDALVQRLQELGKALSQSSREAAYRVSMVLALSDLATSDAEFEFELDLIDALGLSSEDSERLSAEVHEALTVS